MQPIKFAILFSLVTMLSSCAETTRNGMVRDSKSGIQIGSVVEKAFFVDSSQFKNKRIKITTRNVTGNPDFRLQAFEKDFESAMQGKGFIPVKDDSFGIKMDINVVYNGHAQTNLSKQFAFLGGSAGGIAGYRSEMKAGTAVGVLTGATLGSIIGSYITNDTYVIVTEVSIGITDYESPDSNTKVIKFSSSKDLQVEKSRDNFNPFREVVSTKIAVYAGGRNVEQEQIIAPIKFRLTDIIKDLI
ncbi:MAG: complement resistance protein TraT [Methylophilaceae bacterium]|nr:complement resistance protein TraT [Methylophilaceae bacterium]